MRGRFPRTRRSSLHRVVPIDLAVVLGVVVLGVLAVAVPGIRESPLRAVVALPLLLFVPGYAVLAVLFPEAGEGTDAGSSDEEARRVSPVRGIDPTERVVLSVPLSVVVVPLIGLVANATPWGITLAPVVLGVSAFTVIGTVVAVSRRRALPREEQFLGSSRDWGTPEPRALLGPGSTIDLAVTLLLAVSILLALGSVGYAAMTPQPGEEFTEFQVLAENETGELVADGYPAAFDVGEPGTVVLRVANHEREATSYSVVVQQQRVETATIGNQTTVTVADRAELDRLDTGAVAPNETRLREYQVSPTMAGDRTRLVFLLYRDGAPDDPTVENAYRDARLWIDVEEG